MNRTSTMRNAPAALLLALGLTARDALLPGPKLHQNPNAPTHDPQASVYAAVQAKLDTALTLLGGSGAGPGSADLVYKGDKTKWTQAAHTLKARFYLHLAEVDNSNYARALAQAQQGIAASANDFKS